MAIASNKYPEEFYDISIKEGGHWLERNKKYYSTLTIPLKIIRWDRWLKHSNFAEQLNIIQNTYNSIATYKNVIDKSINDFLAKLSKRLPNAENFNWERTRQLSFNFVTEECAALCLWPELKCNFELYPIRHNEARKLFVLPKHPCFLRAGYIVLRNVKQMKPQSFSAQNY